MLLQDIATSDSTQRLETDREIAAIKVQSQLFSKAYMQEDVETLVSIYAEDGVAGPGGRDFIRGHEALGRYWQVAEDVDVVSHQASSEAIIIDGNHAYDWGHYTGATVSGGKTRSFRGKYLIVWRKDARDRVWRMVQDIDWHVGSASCLGPGKCAPPP